MLDAQRLQVLAEVARAGSIASAARRLAFTPSAVSQQIGKLEHDLGCEVLHRHPRGVTLTPVGQALVAHAEAVTGELRAAEQTVRAMLGTQPRRLAVGTFASAGQSLVPAALARYRSHHPDVALSLTDLEPPDGYGLVISGDLDLLITHRYPSSCLPIRGLHRQLLLHDPLQVAVLPADHPKARSARLGVTDLADDEWISGGVGEPNRVSLELAGHSGAAAAHRLRNPRLPGHARPHRGRARYRARPGQRARPHRPTWRHVPARRRVVSGPRDLPGAPQAGDGAGHRHQNDDHGPQPRLARRSVRNLGQGAEPVVPGDEHPVPGPERVMITGSDERRASDRQEHAPRGGRRRSFRDPGRR